jgi:hypothetical protein
MGDHMTTPLVAKRHTGKPRALEPRRAVIVQVWAGRAADRASLAELDSQHRTGASALV